MQFHYIGINYKDAGLSIRDKISFTDQKKMEFLAQMEALGIRQCLILSTCNRSEVFYLDEDKCNDMIKKLYQSMFPEANLDHSLHEQSSEAALLYFYRIAAGLESQVLGEDQILGQVREAYEFSRTQGYTGKELNRIAQDAIAAAKRIKNNYHISEQPLSIAYIGIQHLNDVRPIRGQCALVIGSGQTAALAVRYLHDYGAAEVYACSRNFSHAKKLQEEFPEIRVISYEKRYEVLSDCSIIVSATSAPHLVLRKTDMEESEGDISEKCVCEQKTIQKHASIQEYTRQQPVRSRAFLDLAAPRDIDPAIGDMPDTVLIDLDMLQQVSEQNMQKREQLSKVCQEVLLDAVRETEEWLDSSRVDQTLATLQEKCDEIVEDSYAYLNRKIALEPREQKILKRTIRASLNRLLREPIQELKHTTPDRQETYEQVLRDLFHMDGE